MLCQSGVLNLGSWVELAGDSSAWTIFLAG